MTTQEITGSQALAYGALEAGVQFVTGYPGSPATSVVDALRRVADERVRIEWAINEKSAFDAAFGASLAGVRSLLCLKSVGLNVAPRFADGQQPGWRRRQLCRPGRRRSRRLGLAEQGGFPAAGRCRRGAPPRTHHPG